MGRERDSGSRHIIELPLGSNLDKVARLFIATLGGGLHAIALALSTKEDNSAEIRELARKVRTAREKLQTSVHNADNQQQGD